MIAGLSYLLLPVSGLFAYLRGRAARTRFHGLQAIALGTLWPVAMLAASKVSATATQIVFAIGALVWLGFMVLAFFGRDPRLPGIGRALKRAAEPDPKAR